MRSMKRCITMILLLLLILTGADANAQSVTIRPFGSGCGATGGYPYVSRSTNLNFMLLEPYLTGWRCISATGGAGTLFVFVAAPSTRTFQLPSIHKNCLLHGALGIWLPVKITSASIAFVAPVGVLPKFKFDVVVQGVVVLTTTAGTNTCPFYLSATPAWRVSR
jgi:hypothetical protein